MAKQSEEEWWGEDADRINQMSKRAKDSGKTIELKEGAPPKLNKDGGLEDNE